MISLLGLILTDTAAGITWRVPQGWQAEGLFSGATLKFGQVEATVEYGPSKGRGHTVLDIIRLVQEDVKEFLSTAYLKDYTATDEVKVEGGVAYWATASGNFNRGDEVRRFFRAGWRLGERGTIGYEMKITFVKRGSRRFTPEEKRAMKELVKGLKFD